MMIYLRKIYNCITRTRYNNKANGCAKKQNKVYLSRIHLNTQGGHKDGYEYCMPGSGRSTGAGDLDRFCGGQRNPGTEENHQRRAGLR